MPTKYQVRNDESKSLDIVYQEIQELLGSYDRGLSVLSLSSLEIRYPQKYEGSLDYNSLGVNCIEELLDKMHDKGMVLFYEERRSKKKYVMCARTVKSKQSSLKRKVQELLNDRGGSIPASDFEVAYKYKFKVNLDYHHFCLKDFDHLCSVLDLVVEVANSGELVLKAVNYLRNMPTNPLKVYQEIQEIIGRYHRGIPESLLSSLESIYQRECKRSLDYNSLGVNNIEDLLYKMRDEGMVLFSEEPESHMTYVMSTLLLKRRQKEVLRPIVQELLHENDGEIPLIDFEDSFKNKFMEQLDYHYFGLKDIYSLCEVLNLVVDAGNPNGQVVIKGQIYNLSLKEEMNEKREGCHI